MKLYIIGNGFDLAHGLPTRYWDFRKFLEEKYPMFLIAFEDNYSIYPGTSISNKQKLLWNELEANLANIDENLIVESNSNIELGLEGGDIDIEDTLYYSFSAEYGYIQNLRSYLKEWIQNVKLSNLNKITSKISNNNMYISFNYTDVLEKIYKIDDSNIVHIHGSLKKMDIDPVLGHGNFKKIELIQKKIDEAQMDFKDKISSIFRVIKDYYEETFKDVQDYISELRHIPLHNIDEIIVVGHSLAGVDQSYFSKIDELTKKKLNWIVYYYIDIEKNCLKENLMSAGISERRIFLKPDTIFYDFILK